MCFYIKELPEDKKKALRVAQYLFQQLNKSTEARNPIETMLHKYSIIVNTDTLLDKQTIIKLYGYMPFISNAHIRNTFLHLLLHIHGSAELEEKLTSGILALCLVDLIRHLSIDPKWTSGMPHALIKDHPRPFQEGPSIGKGENKEIRQNVNDIMRLFGRDKPEEAVVELQLLNF